MDIHQEQINKIYDLIMELAGGNLSARAETSDDYNELDAITICMNMLAEELQATTVSRNYLSRIYDGVVDILLVLNPDFTIQSVNDVAARVLNYSQEELLGMPFGKLLYRQDTGGFTKIRSELSRKGVFYGHERAFISQKGKKIPVSISASVLKASADDENPDILVIAKDITKIKKTENDLLKKNEQLNSFIYRISHDIKGPLSSILGLVYLAKSDADDINAVNEYLGLIEQSANRLDNIIADLLELGQLTQKQVNSSTINLKSFIEEILDSLKYTPEYAGVKFQIDVEQLPVIKTKKALLTAALQNLILNAIQYKRVDEPDPYVQVNAYQRDSEYIISVSDNGVGMDKATMENIFQMFFRGDTTSKGTGLGLYIVQTSVNELKGRVEVKSKLGQGSTFTLHIPIRKS